MFVQQRFPFLILIEDSSRLFYLHLRVANIYTLPAHGTRMYTGMFEDREDALHRGNCKLCGRLHRSREITTISFNRLLPITGQLTRGDSVWPRCVGSRSVLMLARIRARARARDAGTPARNISGAMPLSTAAIRQFQERARSVHPLINLHLQSSCGMRVHRTSTVNGINVLESAAVTR